jgi:hypothetical protein
MIALAMCYVLKTACGKSLIIHMQDKVPIIYKR